MSLPIKLEAEHLQYYKQCRINTSLLEILYKMSVISIGIDRHVEVGA